ncbi:MAG: hypothetical protein KGL75_09765 [Acidobacteriota bacterium]|nr:hypothetical protein [Acidobacteriota bacterium]
MKLLISICLSVVLGLTTGYFLAPIASVAYMQSAHPDLFGAYIFFLADNFAFCLRQNEPPTKSIETVTKSLDDIQTWHAKDPKNRYLAQETGLVEAQRARLELKGGQTAQAEQDIRDSQRELTALGWKDVTQNHLIKVTAQVTSEYSH